LQKLQTPFRKMAAIMPGCYLLSPFVFLLTHPFLSHRSTTSDENGVPTKGCRLEWKGEKEVKAARLWHPFQGESKNAALIKRLVTDMRKVTHLRPLELPCLWESQADKKDPAGRYFQNIHSFPNQMGGRFRTFSGKSGQP
jgi:hypothetical protein